MKNENLTAAVANNQAYNSSLSKEYLTGAPHLRNKSLVALFTQYSQEIFEKAQKISPKVKVLDIGAGEGTVTRSFLEMGAQVTALDISQSMLDQLKEKCADFGPQLSVICSDMNEYFKRPLNLATSYHIVTMNSFLHHIPDYISTIEKVDNVIAPGGFFFSFQDPMRYDTVPKGTLNFTKLAYLTWRIQRGDVVGGLKRRLRRSRGEYLDEVKEDNVDYHVVREGVDHEKIASTLTGLGYTCRIEKYFSSESGVWQPVGNLMHMKNTFATIAQKQPLQTAV